MPKVSRGNTSVVTKCTTTKIELMMSPRAVL